MVQWLGLCAHNTGGMDSIPGQGSNVLHAAGVCVCQSSDRVRPFVTPWTAVHQAPLSMGVSRQEYWSGLPFPSLGDLPNPGTEPTSPALAGRFFTTEPPGKLDTSMLFP